MEGVPTKILGRATLMYNYSTQSSTDKVQEEQSVF